MPCFTKHADHDHRIAAPGLVIDPCTVRSGQADDLLTGADQRNQRNQPTRDG